MTERRLDRIEAGLGDGEPDHGPILWVNLGDWPADDQAAYFAGDAAVQADLIERHCGRRPADTGPHGPIRTVID